MEYQDLMILMTKQEVRLRQGKELLAKSRISSASCRELLSKTESEK